MAARTCSKISRTPMPNSESEMSINNAVLVLRNPGGIGSTRLHAIRSSAVRVRRDSSAACPSGACRGASGSSCGRAPSPAGTSPGARRTVTRCSDVIGTISCPSITNVVPSAARRMAIVYTLSAESTTRPVGQRVRADRRDDERGQFLAEDRPAGGEAVRGRADGRADDQAVAAVARDRSRHRRSGPGRSCGRAARLDGDFVEAEERPRRIPGGSRRRTRT